MFLHPPHVVLLSFYLILHIIYLFLVKSSISVSPGANIALWNGGPYEQIRTFPLTSGLQRL